MTADLRLIAEIKQALRQCADPEKAPGMQAYMKSTMPFLGVQAPPLRSALKPVLAQAPFTRFEDWRDTVLALWRGAEYREERYAAIELARHRNARTYLTPAALSMLEEMIVSGAWWDLVDPTATHLIAAILEHHPLETRTVLEGWAQGDEKWLRRTAIIAQVSFRRRTDTVLLFQAIEPSIGDCDFFLRKAIGWALREFAKVNPEAVASYVDLHPNLSPLSRSEAARGIGMGRRDAHESKKG